MKNIDDPDLTVPQLAAALTVEQVNVLRYVNAGLVHSSKPHASEAVRYRGENGTCFVTRPVRALEAAGLVERTKADWFLTPAGAHVLNRRAGGGS